jgi:phosphoglycolate phosphatase
MTRPPALLFDLDGTLVDSAITIAAALSTLAAERGGAAVDLERTRALVGRGATMLVREALGPLAGDSEADVAAFRDILAAMPVDPAMVYAGVRSGLRTLVAAGHRCAVVTNKPERLATLLLDQLDLARFFAVVVGGDSLDVCKPAPAPLRHAARAMGATAQRAVMNGDSYVDARAAGAAGMPFVLYLGGYEAHRCGSEMVAASFGSFDDLPALLLDLEVRLKGNNQMTT